MIDSKSHPCVMPFGSSFLSCVEPGKQAKSAVRIKNTSKSNVAFKVYSNKHVHLVIYAFVLHIDVTEALSTNGLLCWTLLLCQSFCKRIIHLYKWRKEGIFIFLSLIILIILIRSSLSFCAYLVSNKCTQELFHATSWGNSSTWREYNCNW